MNRRPLQRPSESSTRSGAVLVENALVISVFAVFLAGIMEFGHAYLIVGTLNSAAKRAARYGAVEGVSTNDVRTAAKQTLDGAMKSARATILIKDGSVFDQSGMNPESVNYSSLPNIELRHAKSRQLYIVRITVPYEDVALIPPFWAKGITLRGQAVMRHE